MHVVFDARPLQSASGNRGIGRYAFELLAALARQAPDLRFTFLRTEPGEPPRLPDGLQGDFIPYPARVPEQLRGLADAVLLPRLLRSVRADLYHSPEYGLPAGSPMPVVVTVHDLIPWAVRHPSYRRQRLRWAAQVRLLRRAAAVVCDSMNTREAVVGRFRVPPDRATVAYPGVGRLFFDPPERATRWLPRGDIGLMVGECDWRKRPEDALEAIRRIETLQLVIVGPNRRHADRLRGLAVAAGVEHRLTISGSLSDADLRRGYADARLLLFPSRYEGFGLPVLEAAAAGLPVVAYANSALPEICGPAIPLVPDGDRRAFSQRARGLLESPEQSWDGEAARSRAAEFTWEGTARSVLEAYQRVAGRPA